jgi:hypothetical protein
MKTIKYVLLKAKAQSLVALISEYDKPVHESEINKWENTLKEIKVGDKVSLINEARVVWGTEKTKYDNNFDIALEKGIEIPASVVEVAEIDNKKLLFKKTTELDKIKSDLYVGSRPEDDSIDWVLGLLIEKGYEITKK